MLLLLLLLLAGRMVETVEEVGMRCAVGRRFAWVAKLDIAGELAWSVPWVWKGESSAGPSKGEGEGEEKSAVVCRIAGVGEEK